MSRRHITAVNKSGPCVAATAVPFLETLIENDRNGEVDHLLAGFGRDQNCSGTAWPQARRLPEIQTVLHQEAAPLEGISQPKMRQEELPAKAHRRECSVQRKVYTDAPHVNLLIFTLCNSHLYFTRHRHLMIPLVQAERCWAYAMQLRQEANKMPRKIHHSRQRLRKAVKYADLLERLASIEAKVDARTALEAQVPCGNSL